MNRAARQHLLGVLGDNPVLVATVPSRPRVARATEELYAALGVRGWFVLRPGDLPARVRVVRGSRS